MKDRKRTRGGSILVSYENRMPDRRVAVEADPEWRGVLQGHLERHLGEGRVFHEVVSESIQLDLSLHEPTAERPWYTLVTMGVSDCAASVPDEAEEWQRIELVAYLPSGWNVDFPRGGEESWWPGRMLKQLGRFMHNYRTFLAPGHTVPNPDGVYTMGSLLNTALLVPPFLDDEEFHGFADEGKEGRLLAVWPITEAECRMKLERGTGDLLDALESGGITPVIDPWRSCAVSGRRPPAMSRP